MKNKMETSKKIALFSAICFAVVLLFSMAAFIYESIVCSYSDSTMLITLISVSGATFGTACAFYYNKAKGENLFKLKRSFLKYKYSILQDMKVLDEDYAESEVEKEIDNIEEDFEEEETLLNQEITYNE